MKAAPVTTYARTLHPSRTIAVCSFILCFFICRSFSCLRKLAPQVSRNVRFFSNGPSTRGAQLSPVSSASPLESTPSQTLQINSIHVLAVSFEGPGAHLERSGACMHHPASTTYLQTCATVQRVLQVVVNAQAPTQVKGEVYSVRVFSSFGWFLTCYPNHASSTGHCVAALP